MGIPTNGLVLYLPLYSTDLQGSPIISKDISQTSCEVTGASWRVRGRFFDGADDYISAGNPSFTANQQGTILIWFRLDTTAEQHMFTFAKTSTGVVDEFKFEFRGGDEYIAFEVHVKSIYARNLRTNNTTFLANTWNLVALTSNGSANKIYKNDEGEQGYQSNIGTDGIWLGDLVEDADEVLIGVLGRSGSYIYDCSGTIGEVLVYNRALTATEIADIYNETVKTYKACWGFATYA